MKCLFLVGIFISALLLASAERSSRKKRFVSLRTAAGGGRLGCTVVQNQYGNYSLFINAYFDKFLTNDEVAEYTNYKEKFNQYSEELKTYIAQRQAKEFGQQNQQFRQRLGRGDKGKEQLDSTKEIEKAEPVPPQKPSFCNSEKSVQYVFTGCLVQGDNLYVGDNFVRKLTGDDQIQLEKFRKDLEAYQKQIAKTYRKQFEVFAKDFPNLFEPFAGLTESKEGTSSNSNGELAVTADDKDNGTIQSLQPPKAPDFCTVIL